MAEKPYNPSVDDILANAGKTVELSRRAQFDLGQITVDDLDDEELARGQFRDRNGGFSGMKANQIPQAFHAEAMRRLFHNANTRLRTSLMDMMDVMVQIAKGDAYEPADRIRAATWVAERVMGKNPDVVIHTQDKPWEVMFSDISGGSRAESRARRGVASQEDLLALETVDAEVVSVEHTAVSSDEEEAFFTEGVDVGSPVQPSQGQPLEARFLTIADQEEYYRQNPPPKDPHARHVYEKDFTDAMADESGTAPRGAEDIRERINKARARRFAARAHGLATTRNLGYEIESKELVAPTEEAYGLYRIKFILPEEVKVPQTILNKEQRQRKQQRTNSYRSK